MVHLGLAGHPPSLPSHRGPLSILPCHLDGFILDPLGSGAMEDSMVPRLQHPAVGAVQHITGCNWAGPFGQTQTCVSFWPPSGQHRQGGRVYSGVTGRVCQRQGPPLPTALPALRQ